MWISIAIGVFSSIVATIIWYVLSQLWRKDDRKCIRMELEIALTSLYEIEEKIGYPEDYTRILQQADRMYDSLNRAFGMIKIFTYGFDFDRKKMITTIIWENIRLCEYSKNVTVGYSKDAEIEERCERIAKRLDIKGSTNTGMSVNLISLYVAKDLNDNVEAKKSLHTWMKTNGDNALLKEQLLNKQFIEINTFKCGLVSKIHIKHYCFTKEEYEQYLDKILK